MTRTRQRAHSRAALSCSLVTHARVDRPPRPRVLLPPIVVDVQHSSVRFLGSLVLNLWDCGGQDNFYESYFQHRREHVFRNVAVLIYVFDVSSADVDVSARRVRWPPSWSTSRH